ncbi:hypothetical protein [uncultured Erythrobacter sp.]|uniref:hypothetical protein n=1 Tax=uncultured Erythrobacter sp. TaxID=263913 RepID=UPI002625D847|nr:hypothetical protein [uncultured Erythrobacter sp.]
MRVSHLYLFGVAVATLGMVAAAPIAASTQDAPSASPPTAPQLSEKQQAEVSGWPSEQQAQYELWPAETQAYYWELSKPRQSLFWQLPDEDKIALTAMTGPERDAAWQQLESRAASSPR